MNNKITLKELRKEIIFMKAEMRVLSDNQGLGRKHATRLALMIIFSVLMDIFIHAFLFFRSNF